MQTSLEKIISACLFVILATACGAKPAPMAKPVPDELQTIEAQAEDIIDIVPAGQWAKVTADVEAIAEAWSAYRPQAEDDGATQAVEESFDHSLADLQSLSAAQDAAGTLQAANNVSAAVVELFDLYHPAIPADIGRLDVLERQVILDVAEGDYARAADTLTQTRITWEKVKQSILDHNGQEAASDFDASLAIQESAVEAKDASKLTAEARNALELVDVMERLY